MTTLRPSALKAALAATVALSALSAAHADSYFFRSRAITFTTEAVGEAPGPGVGMRLQSVSGASASVDAARPWSFRFEAIGGKAPYTFSVEPELKGALAGVKGTQEGALFTLSGSAARGTYPIVVTATDSEGASKSASLSATVTSDAVAASKARPTMTYRGGPSRSYFEQPDWNVLYDGDASTGFTVYPEETHVVVQRFAGPVTADRILIEGNASFQIEVDGKWMTPPLASQGTVRIFDKAYDVTAVRYSGSYNTMTEARLGAGDVARPPVAKSAATGTVAPNQALVADVSFFETRSPYHTGAFSLAGTSPVQNGVRLEVTSQSVKVLSRPAHNAEVTVKAVTEDGLPTWAKFQVQATGEGPSVWPRPSGFTSPGTPALAYVDQPAWNTLYDGNPSSGVTVYPTESNAVVQRFAEAVTTDTLLMQGTDQFSLEIDGKWVSPPLKSNGTVKILNHAYDITAVRFFGQYTTMTEARLGNGPTAPPPVAKANIRTVVGPADIDVADASMFEVTSPYSPGTVDLSQTSKKQNGVTLDVSAERVRVVSRPAHATDVFVKAVTADGQSAWAKIQVRGTDGGTVSMFPRPSSMEAPGTPSLAYTDQPTWNVLYDDNPSSGVTVYPTESNAVVQRFAQAVTTDRFLLQGTESFQIEVGGNWINPRIKSNGTVKVFERPYDITAVRFNGQYNTVPEARLGAGPAAPSPTVKPGIDAVVEQAQAQVADSSMFAVTSPYAPGAVSLAQTPAKQNGVQLSVSADSVSVLSRPADTTDVFVRAVTADGLSTWAKFTVHGTAGITQSKFATPTSVAVIGTSRAYAEQPEWNVFYDGSTSTGSNGYPDRPSTLSYGDPVFTDSLYLYGTDSFQVEVGGNWINPKMKSNGTVKVFDRPYEITGVQFYGRYNTVSEVRLGNGPEVKLR